MLKNLIGLSGILFLLNLSFMNAGNCPNLSNNVDYNGGDLFSVKNIQIEDCCALCNQISACSYITFATGASNTYCYIKNSTVVRVEGSTGRQSASFALPTTTTCQRQDGKYYANNFDSFKTSVASYDDCCKLCGSKDACLAFTYLSDKKVCILNTIEPVSADLIDLANAVSGFVLTR